MIDILYEDNHLLALNKPAGLLTQPSGTERNSLEAQAKAWIKETLQKPGEVYLHVIHRLDTPVSGIVLFARTSKALSRLQQQSREGKFVKVYEAVVAPPPKKRLDHLRHWLIHRDHYAEVVTPKHADTKHAERHAERLPEAKIAELDYETLQTTQERALLKVQLQTGRYHQIRAQLGAIGSPIIGDKRYGSSVALGGPGIALQHTLLEFYHPTTAQLITLECPRNLPHFKF